MFSPGDKVIVTGVEGSYDHHGFIGTVTTIVRGPCRMVNAMTKEWHDVYIVDLPSPTPLGEDDYIGFRAQHLKPYYDGNQKTEWEEGEWQPISLERVLQ
jgi:hypothetical protein